jgi:chromosome segregation ATPase
LEAYERGSSHLQGCFMFGWYDSKKLTEAINAMNALCAKVSSGFEDVLSGQRQLRAQLLLNDRQNLERMDLLMKTVDDLKGSVGTLTSEVAETKELIKSFREGNKEQEQMIADLRGQVESLRLDNAQKAALLAGIEEIDQAIKDQSAELDAAQKEPTAPEPPVTDPANPPSGGDVTNDGQPI